MVLYFVIAIACISELFIARQLRRSKFRIVLFYLSLAVVLSTSRSVHFIGFLMMHTLCMSGLYRYRNKNYVLAMIAFIVYGMELFLLVNIELTIFFALIVLSLVLVMTRKMDWIIRFDYIFYTLFLIVVGPMQYSDYYYNETMVIIMLTFNFFRSTLILRKYQNNQIENQIFFESIVKFSPNSIVLTNTRGIMLYVNESAQRLSGYKVEELIGKKTSIFRSGETPIEVYKDMWHTISSGDIWQGTIKNRKKNGETYWETLSITPIFNKDGVVEFYLGTKNDTSYEVQRMRSLEEDAHLDDLTGTMRRKYFEHVVFEHRQIHTSRNAIIMFDIDDYKVINDTYGHQIGDDILRQISQLLLCEFSEAGYVCRYGGDEFCVFTHDLLLEEVEEKIRHILQQLNSISFINHRKSIKVNMSYGMHRWSMEETMEDAIKKADEGMYSMKRLEH